MTKVKASHLLKLTKELDFLVGLETVGLLMALILSDGLEAGDEGTRTEGMVGSIPDVVVVVAIGVAIGVDRV